ncbi:SMC family ATPase [Candidatus Albibeggiatoa sp. nov. NOAA]|uniref:SMC family ATPase n=1 Tax=Candidatus Albibeggiatoa sp. nov. NOAA TaxID=3162724 RepID=UPI0032FDC5DB|nr:SMC family ATPase [Thiotrichaceae bacterium]
MIPIKLIIEGLYSYQKKQVIEFEKLTSAKLFGIFGAVGSGKTTILEAISLALYGECEKLGKRNISYNLMNLKVDNLYIEYEFKTFSNEYYKFIAQAKRKKVFSEVSGLKRAAYQKINKEWKPIKTTSATELLGLSYDYFKRTIIVPQGKFQEFLQLAPKDRTTMLKDIFGLQRFDLYDKAADLDKANKTKLNQIQGQLTHLAEVDDKYILTQKQALIELKQALTATSEQLAQEQKQFQQQQTLQTLFLDIQQQKQILQGLLAKITEFEILEQKITQYEICYKQFSVLLSQQNSKQQELNQLTQQLENLQKMLVAAENQSDQAQQVVNQAQNEIEQLQRTRDELQKALPDITLLGEVKIWLQKRQNLQQQAAHYQSQLHSLQQGIAEIEQQKYKIISEQLQHYTQDDWQNLDFQQLLNQVQIQIQQFESQLLDIEQNINELSIKAKLEEHAQNLHAGQACPLCGSIKHPKPLQQTNIIAELSTYQQQKQTIQQHIRFCRQQQTYLQALATKLQLQQQHIQQNQQYYTESQNSLAEHEKQFIWPDFRQLSESEIEQQYSQSKQMQQQIAQLQKKLDTQSNTLHSAQNQFSVQQNQSNQLQGQINSLKNYEQNYQTQLQILDQQITQALQQTDYQSVEQVKHILSEDLKIDVERAKINQFNQQLHTVQQHLHTLQVKTQDQQFDPEQFELSKQNVVELENRLEQHKKNIITLEHTIQQLQIDWQKKQKLQIELGELEARAHNIDTLKKLFHGSGFVNYVSTVFLQDLVNAANDRFIRLTEQKLRLELNDKNEFEVRDYMNDGQLRSVKTLSGGQIFQASLSLALALSDSIQKTTQTTQNFFFLDEGFGSQDKESLQLVFDTLKSLRHENKVVGIISHVDDLKQELDYYLTVKNTDKRGSIVAYHWG